MLSIQQQNTHTARQCNMRLASLHTFVVILSLLDPLISLSVYELDHGDQKVVFNSSKVIGQPLQVKDVFALCYQFKFYWALGDYWRIDHSEGFFSYHPTIRDYTTPQALWNFNDITTIFFFENPADYFQLRWTSVCYIVDYLDKSVSFFMNGKMVSKGKPDGLKNSPNNANITKITLVSNQKGLITNANLITRDITPELMIAITSCKDTTTIGPVQWNSGVWSLLDGNDTSMEKSLSLDVSLESLCDQKPYFVILPKSGFWLGKEVCNTLSGKGYLYTNETERLAYTDWVRAWHEKIGSKPRPILDITDEEEEGVWISTETGEVVAIFEKAAPHRISEHKYENWRPGQPNGGRTENNANYDAYYPTGQGWVDGCSWCYGGGYFTCQVRE